MNWTASTSRPGYGEKQLKRGPVTITVYRPELSPKESEARKKATAAALSPILAKYIRRIEE